MLDTHSPPQHELDLNESSSQPGRGGGHRREHAIEYSEMSWASGHVDVPPSLSRAHVACATTYFSKSIFPIIHVITNMIRYRLHCTVLRQLAARYCDICVVYRDNIRIILLLPDIIIGARGRGHHSAQMCRCSVGCGALRRVPNTRHACVLCTHTFEMQAMRCIVVSHP